MCCTGEGSAVLYWRGVSCVVLGGVVIEGSQLCRNGRGLAVSYCEGQLCRTGRG